MLLYFRARPKDFGCVFLPASVSIAATANTTNTYGIMAISDKNTVAPVTDHTGYIDDIFAAAVTAPIDADGTTLLNVYKYDASAAAAVDIKLSFNLEGLTDGKADRIGFETGLTDQQRILDYGDFLYCTVVNNSAAIDTAMVGGMITAHVKMLT